MAALQFFSDVQTVTHAQTCTLINIVTCNFVQVVKIQFGFFQNCSNILIKAIKNW